MTTTVRIYYITCTVFITSHTLYMASHLLCMMSHSLCVLHHYTSLYVYGLFTLYGIMHSVTKTQPFCSFTATMPDITLSVCLTLHKIYEFNEKKQMYVITASICMTPYSLHMTSYPFFIPSHYLIYEVKSTISNITSTLSDLKSTVSV